MMNLIFFEDKERFDNSILVNNKTFFLCKPEIAFQNVEIDVENFEDAKRILHSLSFYQLDILRDIRHIPEVIDGQHWLFPLLSWADFEFGIRRKWWADFDENEPISFPKQFKLEDFPEGATTANLAAKLEVFTSITQARKNNVNAPLTKGLHSFKKGKVRAIIV